MMRTVSWLALGVALIASGCGSTSENGCEKRLSTIAALESQLFEAGEVVKEDVRSELMRAYAEFANHCHDEEETPEMLFRRADLLRSEGRFQEAMTQLRDVHDHYKNYDKRAVCAFLVGFIAEVELNDREQAKKTYQQVVELHPGSEAAVWAKQSLDLLAVP